MAYILAQHATLTYDGEIVGGVRSITGIDSGESSEIDVTTLDSTKKEYAQGLGDSGTIEVEILRDFSDDGQDKLAAARNSQLTKTCVITFDTTPSTILTFQAFVKSFGIDASSDDVLMSRASLRITGDIVETAGV